MKRADEYFTLLGNGRKHFKRVFFLLIAMSFLSGNVFAKRIPAPEVEPVIYQGIRHVAPNTLQKMGYLEAWDILTGEKIWEKKIYDVSIDPIMESDVQWVFIKELRIVDNDRIVIINEDDEMFIMDLDD